MRERAVAVREIESAERVREGVRERVRKSVRERELRERELTNHVPQLKSRPFAMRTTSPHESFISTAHPRFSRIFWVSTGRESFT